MWVLTQQREEGIRCCPHTVGRKMAAELLVLLCAAAVLGSAEAQDPYSELLESYRQGVDLVLEQLGSSDNVKLHFRFLKSVEKRELEVNI